VTYTAAAVAGLLAALAVDLLVLRTRLVTRAVFWATYPIVVAFQLLANGILTGRRIVVYNPRDILGARIAHAPVEDLLFGFAMVLLTLSVWVWLGRRGLQRTPSAGTGSALLARFRAKPEP
jgi:lycopene cyclase domain-containing protein